MVFFRAPGLTNLMKKEPDHNSAYSAGIEALIARLERGQFRDGDAQLLARLWRRTACG